MDDKGPYMEQWISGALDQGGLVDSSHCETPDHERLAACGGPRVVLSPPPEQPILMCRPVQSHLKFRPPNFEFGSRGTRQHTSRTYRYT